MGICELPPYAVYTSQDTKGSAPWAADKLKEGDAGEDDDLDLRAPYARHRHLVDQDYPASHASNGHDWISNSMSFVAYTGSGFIATMLADYIRRLGYSARAHTTSNYQVMVPPILLWAGLGEMCRIGDSSFTPTSGHASKLRWSRPTCLSNRTNPSTLASRISA